MMKIQSVICQNCGKLVPRAAGFCILCGEVTEHTVVKPGTEDVVQPACEMELAA